MADNVTVDNVALTDYVVTSDEVTYSGDSSKLQVFRPAHVTGAEGAKTVVEITSAKGLFVTIPDKTQADTVDMTSTANATTAFTLDGYGQATFTVSGTWTSVLVIEFQDNNDAWQFGPNIYPLDPLINTYNIFVNCDAAEATYGAQVGTTSTWKVIAAAGFQAVRLRCMAAGTGTAVVDWRAVYAPYDFITGAVSGDVNHDGVDSGGPLKIGARAEDSLATVTLVPAADRTNLYADLDGTLLVRPQFPLGDLKTDATSNTDGASTASTVFTAVASTKNVITAVHAFRTDAGTTPIYIDFRDGTAGSVLYRVVLPPNGGVVLPAGGTPYFRTAANTALAYDVSAATTTVYINVTGFQSKV